MTFSEEFYFSTPHPYRVQNRLNRNTYLVKKKKTQCIDNMFEFNTATQADRLFKINSFFYIIVLKDAFCKQLIFN